MEAVINAATKKDKEPDCGGSQKALYERVMKGKFTSVCSPTCSGKTYCFVNLNCWLVHKGNSLR